jgi:hypothetical protein
MMNNGIDLMAYENDDKEMRIRGLPDMLIWQMKWNMKLIYIYILSLVPSWVLGQDTRWYKK